MTWNWSNISTMHHRWMMRYLIRRGWVCFYLEEQSRDCRGVCWLQLWKTEEGKPDVR